MKGIRSRDVKELSSIAYLAWMKKVESAQLLTDEMKTDCVEEDVIASTDFTSIQSIQYLAQLRGIDSSLSYLQHVKRCTLEQWKDCYSTFVQLQASQEQLSLLVSKAKEFYEGMDEYIQAMGF